jgi:hypothetical protein
MATPEQISVVLKAAPFRPFEIRLADGRSYRVDHPEFLVLAPGARARGAIYFEQNGRTMHLIDLGLVSEIAAAVPGESADSARELEGAN